MLLDLATLLSLASACAPSVAPATLLAIAKVESGFDPLAIGINGAQPGHLTFAEPAIAVQTARALIAAGRNIDLGLGQVNVRNLGWLGLSVEAAFDPCRNLAASAKVLRSGFLKASSEGGAPQAALRTALSYYNSGAPARGVANGYVAKVTAAAQQLAPVIGDAPRGAGARAPAPREPRPIWEVFGPQPEVRTTFVITPKPGDTP